MIYALLFLLLLPLTHGFHSELIYLFVLKGFWLYLPCCTCHATKTGSDAASNLAECTKSPHDSEPSFLGSLSCEIWSCSRSGDVSPTDPCFPRPRPHLGCKTRLQPSRPDSSRPPSSTTWSASFLNYLNLEYLNIPYTLAKKSKILLCLIKKLFNEFL